MSNINSTVTVVSAAVAAVAAGYALYKSSSSSSRASAGQFVELPLPRRETKNNPPLNVRVLASKQNLSHIDIRGKRVLVRVDYNVPLEEGKVTDTSRVDATLDTLRYLLDPARGARCVVLICHLGRPGGNFDPRDWSLAPVRDILADRLPGHVVKFLPDCVGPEVERAIDTGSSVDNAATGGRAPVFLLENLRHHIEETGEGVTSDKKKVKAETAKVAEFARQLSRLGDVFVFEAFGAAHRPHASVVDIDIPQRVAGLLMGKELDVYARVLGNPQKPFVAIIGGSKVSVKIHVIRHLLTVVDEMVIGGGMAYTFKKVLNNMAIGKSIFDQEGASEVPKIMEEAKRLGVTIHLPVDHVIADAFREDARTGITDDETGVPEGWMALDAGPRTRAHTSAVLDRASTILWNGPLGVFEMGPFAAGTLSAMNDLVVATRRGATTIIGGGDTGAASQKFFVGTRPVADQVTHVSTGGGSSLVLMEGKMLPAVEALSNIDELGAAAAATSTN
jgi:phosphoglycerate kinase